MAPVEINDDYYAILEVSQTASPDAITKSYRRLARVLHPDKNLNNCNATSAFQLLGRAYETISDPEKRRMYDLQWPGIKMAQCKRRSTEEHKAKAAESEQKKAAEQKAKKEEEDRVRQLRLKSLHKVRMNYENDLFEVNRLAKKLAAELKRLEDLEVQVLREERQRNSWWTYVTSPIYGRAEESEEQKQKKEEARLQRSASERVKRSELHHAEGKLEFAEQCLANVKDQIATEVKKIENERAKEAERQERLRKEHEAKKAREQAKQAEEEARRWKEEQEAMFKRAREAREAQAKRAEEEAIKRAQELRKAQEARARQAEEEALRKAQELREAQEAQARQNKLDALKRARERREAREARARQAEEDAKWEKEQEDARKRVREAREAVEAERLRQSEENATKWKEVHKSARKRARELREALEAAEQAELALARKAQAVGRNSATAKPRINVRQSKPTSFTCNHQQFWPKLEGSHTCQNCSQVQRRFAFMCPGCSMVACASCRSSLRGERLRRNNKSSMGNTFELPDDDYEFSYPAYD